MSRQTSECRLRKRKSFNPTDVNRGPRSLPGPTALRLRWRSPTCTSRARTCTHKQAISCICHLQNISCKSSTYRCYTVFAIYRKISVLATLTVDYPVKTPQQLRPLLVGFRKAAGLTQAQLAARLGVTQQTYAQLEAKPESTSLDRLYFVLKLLNVSLVLTQASGPARPEGRVVKHIKSAEGPAPAKRLAAIKSDVKSGTRGTAKTGTKRATDHAKPPSKSRSSEPLPIAPVIKKRENW
jgi:HTH-type transcriptional regulator/antitoxin HipB